MSDPIEERKRPDDVPSREEMYAILKQASLDIQSGKREDEED